MRGKRPRPPIKRTASMTEFTLDLSTVIADHRNALTPRPHRRIAAADLSSPPSPSPHFLSVCSLCHRRLIPGHDIYMYRGDTAFCSLECRQQQMNQDERKAKCSIMSNPGVAGDGSATVKKVSGAGGTVSAV